MDMIHRATKRLSKPITFVWGDRRTRQIEADSSSPRSTSRSPIRNLSQFPSRRPTTPNQKPKPVWKETRVPVTHRGPTQSETAVSSAQSRYRLPRQEKTLPLLAPVHRGKTRTHFHTLDEGSAYANRAHSERLPLPPTKRNRI